MGNTSEDNKREVVLTPAQMKELGAEPCAVCDTLPAFVLNGDLYKGKYPFHSFVCLTCDRSMVDDFLAPNDEDKGIAVWDQRQRDARSEAQDPFDKQWCEDEIKPILSKVRKIIGIYDPPHVDPHRFHRKSDLHSHLDHLQRQLKEMTKLAKEVRKKCVERHGEEFAKPRKML